MTKSRAARRALTWTILGSVMVTIALVAAMILANRGNDDDRPQVARDPATTPTTPTTPTTDSATDDPASPPGSPPASHPATPAGTTSQPATSTILEGVNLTLGYPDTNGDDHSPVETTTEPGVKKLTYCGAAAWAAHDPTVTDLRGATYTAEAEDLRGRTLAAYADADAAAAALDRIREETAACPEQRTDEQSTIITTTSPVARGTDGLQIASRYTWDGEFTTGLTLVQVVQIDDRLYFDYASNEGGFDQESVSRAVKFLTDANDELLTQLGAGPR